MSYAIITPAHNEEAFIEKTLDSMVHQTVRPTRWIIVSDGSTDHTAEIVGRYARQHEFITLVNVTRPPGRHFGNKAAAFSRGLAETAGIPFDYVGNLDADISFEPDYFERILAEFVRDSRLGIAGGMVSSRIGDQFVSQEVALDSVAGAVQLFRRQCFDEVGGYLPLPHGGIDTAAEIIARMKRWNVRTFPELRVLEHRRTGTATAHPIAARVKEGQRLHSLGYGLLFFLVRCIYRASERPVLIGSLAALAGFLRSCLRRDPILLPYESVRFLRSEQRRKLLRLVGLGRCSRSPSAFQASAAARSSNH